MPYIDRNEEGKITAQYARKQRKDQEFIDVAVESDFHVSEGSKIKAREDAYNSRSDKFFLEALRKGESYPEGSAEAKALGLAEVKLIKAEFPID